MAKNLASVKPVKGYGWHYNGRLSGEMRAAQVSILYIPVTLLTTARYKKLMDVVKAAQKWHHDPTAHLNNRVNALESAVQAAEKAGAL